MVYKDLYAILSIPQSSDNAAIRDAYRKAALKYHPDKAKDAASAEKFSEAAESYSILGNAKLRAIYDQYGYDGLRAGAPQGSSGYTEPYVFHGDAIRVFKEFFATDNPFHDLFPARDEFGLVDNSEIFRTRKKQDAAIERDLCITLEEAYLGCIKKMKITRKVLAEDGHTTTMQDKILTIQVVPGWKEGTRVTFPKDGDQGPNNVPADLVFVVKYKPHSRFTRQNMDLTHTATLSLADALTGCVVELITLDGRKLSIPVNEVVRPGTEVKVPSEGMPSTKDPKAKGDLILRFNIVFPQTLSDAQKSAVRVALA